MKRRTRQIVVISVLVILMLSASSPAFAAVVTDSCWTTRFTYGPLSASVGGLSPTYPAKAQTFKPREGGTLDSAVFAMCRPVATSGPIYAELYDVTGEYGTGMKPSGPPLAVSAPVDASAITATQPRSNVVTFRFNNTYTLVAGRHYAIALTNAGAQNVQVAMATISHPHPGNAAGLFGTWMPLSERDPVNWPDKDFWFKVLVNPPDSAPPSSAAVPPSGGSVSAGNVSADFPSGTGGTLTVTQCQPSSPPPAGTGVWISGLYQDVDYDGGMGSGSTTLTVQVPGTYSGDLSALRVLHNVAGQWVEVTPVSVNTSARRLTFPVTSFSLFGITGSGPALQVVTYTPASSTWSLAVLGVVGLAAAARFARRARGAGLRQT